MFNSKCHFGGIQPTQTLNELSGADVHLTPPFADRGNRVIAFCFSLMGNVSDEGW